MRRVCAWAVGGCVLGSATAQGPVPGVVQWEIEKRTVLPLPDQLLRKRDGGTYEDLITNERNRGGYFTTCAIGTPFQNLTLQLDTGSSDIWVPDVTAQACTDTDENPRGCELGAFDPSNSSTYQEVGKDRFNISYLDGSHAKGDYFTDRFGIGGAVIEGLTMGLAVDTDIAYGIVGTGYALNEAIVSDTQTASSAYPNLPVAMQQEHLINTVAYSLWLNDLDANTGNILFGGIDTAKYQGDLTRIRVYRDPSTRAFTSFIVALTGLEAVSVTGSDTLTSREFPIAVVLDSGTTLSYLPADLAQQMWTEAGAVLDTDLDLATIPCNQSDSGGHFAFRFAGPDGPVIRVGMDELVLPMVNGSMAAPTFGRDSRYAGQAMCEFGIQALSGTFLLGDTFLRSAYVVYDLINNEVGLAATDFNATGTHVVAFPSLGATVPSATLAPNQDLATDVPTFSTPAYAAMAGFDEAEKPSVTATPRSSGSGENAAGRAPPLDAAGLAVLGLSLGFIMVGSGFLLL